MRFPQILAVSALALTAACSGSNEPSDTAGEQTSDTATEMASANDGLAVTPDYLAGEWCYERFEAGDDVSNEQITYNFAADGTLKYQNNSSSPVDKDGSYAFTDGVLVIKPAFSMFKLKPATLGDKEMVFEAMGGRFIWSRGACQG
ncbi:hypothetical protein MB02_05635 [Croceicoccus estronivorus]|uniref:hypothetical protein n=1 Tax=Croceicoccus estronivorus TaxID=1172626 RepID=UPI00082EEB4C|nr:hypothetical protein [Croceicoccus estronivorus]OCC24929.1 hypothetical protein MB02_05635 [Croceicoccus estronivorus]